MRDAIPVSRGTLPKEPGNYAVLEVMEDFRLNLPCLIDALAKDGDRPLLILGVEEILGASHALGNREKKGFGLK